MLGRCRPEKLREPEEPGCETIPGPTISEHAYLMQAMGRKRRAYIQARASVGQDHGDELPAPDLQWATMYYAHGAGPLYCNSNTPRLADPRRDGTETHPNPPDLR